MKNLWRTLTVAFLVGVSSVISAVSALPECLQAAETASAADKKQEHVKEISVAETSEFAVHQHDISVQDRMGRALYQGRYPELVAKDGASHGLRAALQKWNAEERANWQVSDKKLRADVRAMQEAGYPILAPYYIYDNVVNWSRIDNRILSFCLRQESYTGGAHPNHVYRAWTVDLTTGRPLALHDIVTNRRDFLTAVAAAFRAQYTGREIETFTKNIDTQLELAHPYLDWDRDVVWTMLPDGGIRVYYGAYAIAPYSAGDFIVDLTPEQAPYLFR
ncbi:MAG: DUF3298 domain-containing protein [Mitsuokella multacida]|jgi:hypothetical protein|uniref:DUF3298 and DUF4163 domain-containing protein n=1 Tax=uncultured Mitsuokella sp. TaxID=453120 RepID=UPI0025FB94F1|nr:DUF3298 and DUF4163 domain-containing protein [uncultured Mitsuokella sp.]